MIASGDSLAYQLETLGTDWFIDYSADPRESPAGTTRVPFISVRSGIERIDPETLALYASGVPGSYWYIGGETNVQAQDGIEPADYVVEFDYYFGIIKAADPTARFLGPSVLNWEFTCTGCGWNLSGKTWMQQFVGAYAAAHDGASPPLDAWAIDAYPLTWVATPEFPNPLPMVDWQLVIDQVQGLRQYLVDDVAGHADTPIWITEMASHWGYNTLAFKDGAPAIPEGAEFQWDAMSDYVANLSDWLVTNGATFGIDRWFIYRGYIDIQAHARNGYAGLRMFETDEIDSPLTPGGEVYRDFALGNR